jgi:tetratricopeptide (TPR) repeat protein
MAHHEEGDIAAAVDEARRALEAEPGHAGLRAYLGSTLVTRQGRFAEGLQELERAREAAPMDPAIYYTLGWCYEFVAYRVSRRPSAGLRPGELYRRAETYLRRCLELNPEGTIKDDAEDLLSSIIKEDVR